MPKELLGNITKNIEQLCNSTHIKNTDIHIESLKRSRMHLLLMYLYDEEISNDLKLELFNDYGSDFDEIPGAILDIMNGGEEDANE